MKSPTILLCFLVVLLPFILADESEKEAEINFERGQDVLVLNCSLTNTPDKVNWVKDGNNLEMVTNKDGVVHLKDREAVTFTHNTGVNVHSLTITKPKVTDIGNYTCSSVSSDAAVEVESEKFSVLMPTIVVKIVALNNIIDGEELLLTCNAVGNPPTEIQWFKMAEPESKDPKDYWTMMGSKTKIEANDPRIFVNSSAMSTTMSSHLNIKEIQLEDRFVYMCLADNRVDSAISSNSTILIRVVGKYAALWPFLGICAEVLVLCIVIFVYEKRRGNKKLDDESDQNNSKHAVNSKDSEVRHRK